MSTGAPVSKKAINLAHQIFHLGMKTPAHVADVWVQWHPHIDRLEVQVHPRGWKAGVSGTHIRMVALEKGELEMLMKDLVALLERIKAGDDIQPVEIWERRDAPPTDPLW